MPLERILNTLRDIYTDPSVKIRDFSKPDHVNLFTTLPENKCRIVYLPSENIPLPYSNHSGYALKISVGANETVTLNIPDSYSNLVLYMYNTGTAIASISGTGAIVEANSQNQWQQIMNVTLFAKQTPITIQGGSNGGSVYITDIILFRTCNPADPTLSYVSPLYQGYPNLQSTTTASARKSFLVVCNNLSQLWLYGWIKSNDGTAVTLDVNIQTVEGTVTIVSYTTTSTSPAGGWLGCFPVMTGGENTVFFQVTYIISGNATLTRYWVRDTYIQNYNSKLPSSVLSASASNASTTAATYTLLDNSGRTCNIDSGSISISVPSTGGSATIIINGITVKTYAAGAAATFDIPNNWEIYKIQVSLAGDGTNAATASLSGFSRLKPYLVRR